MGARDHIKKALKSKGKSIKGIAERRGVPYQTFRNQLFRDRMGFRTVEEIADCIGCDVALIDRETGDRY